MKCLICDSASEYYFSKTYSEPPFDRFMTTIGPVDYWKCVNCGFVLSKTHADLDDASWGDLNKEVHDFLEGPANSDRQLGNQPPYLDQAAMVAVLGRHGIIDTGNMLDYAAGYGTLSSLLDRYFGLTLPIYDAFVRVGDDSRYVQQPGVYKTVINSAMFEHIRCREDLEDLHALCADDGCLILHTVICENIPADPDWFYIRPPVHTAFHTNKSMDILMRQWGFTASIYSPKAKSWVLLKTGGDMADSIAAINQEVQDNYLIHKQGFVDYWKGF
jgi:hypothetical protein